MTHIQGICGRAADYGLWTMYVIVNLENTCKELGSPTGVSEDSGLLQCCAALLGELLLTF
jgi:hypothetical protein